MVKELFYILSTLFIANPVFAQMQFFRNSASSNTGAGQNIAQTRKFTLETQKEQQVQKVELDRDVRIVPQESNTGSINQVKYSANGKYLLSADMNNAKIWDVSSGRLIRSIELANNVYQSTAKKADLSSDGTFCVYISQKLDVEICDIKTGLIKKVASFSDKQEKETVALALSPNDSLLAVLTYDTIYIYDVPSLKKIAALESNYFDFFMFPVFSSDSKKLGMIANNKNSKDTLDTVLLLTISTRKFSTIITTGAHSEYLDISPNGKHLACTNTNKELVVADISKAKVIERRKREELVDDIKFSPNSMHIFVATGSRALEIHDNEGYISADDINGYSIAFSSDKKKFCLGKNGEIKIYDMEFLNWKVQKTISGASSISKVITSFGDENWLYLGAAKKGAAKKNFIFNKNFELLRLDDFYVNDGSSVGGQAIVDIGKLYTKSEGNSYSLYNHPFFGDADYKIRDLPEVSSFPSILQNSDITLTALREENKIHIYKGIKYLGYYETESSFSSWGDFISPTRRFVVSDDRYGKSYIADVRKGEVRQTDGEYIVFSCDDKYIAMSEKTGEITVYDTDSWQAIKHFKGYGYACFSRTGKYFTASNVYGTINLYDFETGKEIRKITTDRGNVCGFTEDDSKFIFLTYGDIARVFSTETGEILASIMADDTGDWFIYTPEGYFNGSESGIQKFVHLVRGMEIMPLNQFAETLYRPDIVVAKLRGENLTEFTENTSLAKIISTGDAPAVQFKTIPTSVNNRDITVDFIVQDMGGGIGSVYLKLNDKTIKIAEGSRKLELVGGNTSITQQQGGKTTQYSHLLSLSNGENTIEAYATNAAGKIESRHAVTKITWQGATQKPNLYVLAVGVNKYRDRSLWLQYSVPDAQSVSQSFDGQKTSLYQNIFTYELLDENVTKENLNLQFKELSHKVGADDVFVLFIAGHGTTNQKTGDYYFIPSNFRYTDSDAILTQGVSKNDILSYMSGIKAGKTLIMLDTCNSGAFTNDTAQRGFAEKTALERLVRATGQAVITAASEEQSAMEGYEGHGIFTYILLEALSGKADKNADGYTTLNELAAYIEEQVPERSYQKWGYEQVPMKELRKQDFPLVGK